MYKHCVKNVALCLFLLSLIFGSTSCSFNGGCNFWPKVKLERAEEHTIAASDIEIIDVQSLFGSINITGSDRDNFFIEADINIQAKSQEKAELLAEQTKIKIEPDNGKLRVYVEHPRPKNNQSVGVSFKILAPKTVTVKTVTSFGLIHLAGFQSDVTARTSFSGVNCKNINGLVDAQTSYGNVNLEDIVSENIKAKTSFSSVLCKNVTGPVDLRTSYGNINCNSFTSNNIRAHSSFGNVNIYCSDDTSSELAADVSTSYGNITFKTPPAYTGKIQTATSFGSINSDLPITVQGKISKDRISGSIGSGTGMLKLKTSFGSIKIK